MICSLQTQALPFLSLPNAIRIGDRLNKLCKAISDFLIQFWQKIVTCLRASLHSLKDRCCWCYKKKLPLIPPPLPQFIEPNSPIQTRLSFYRNFPLDSILFLQRAIDLHKALLRAEDLQLSHGEEKQLDYFNGLIEDLDVNLFPTLMKIAIRAFIFTDRDIPADHCPSFFCKQPSLPNRRNAYYEIFDLKKIFEELPDEEKSVVFNVTDASHIDGYKMMSEQGKKLFRGIQGIADDLIQGNRGMEEVIQAVTRQLQNR